MANQGPVITNSLLAKGVDPDDSTSMKVHVHIASIA